MQVVTQLQIKRLPVQIVNFNLATAFIDTLKFWFAGAVLRKFFKDVLSLRVVTEPTLAIKVKQDLGEFFFFKVAYGRWGRTGLFLHGDSKLLQARYS